ncbi:MAG: hypothetical protein GY714_21740 [Desulfobacterales bacterium]|nr:hypothetical protein [Desulfobacterales bacterium]MCP4160568.1 hypothetical protein [Deltaproteobacteria bacterium]
MKKILLIISFLIIPISLLAGETVTVTGVSFFEKDRTAIAREKALAEAKRMAIEKAFGAKITSKTVVSNFEVLQDQIMSRSSGYISKVIIIKEEATNLGTYEVTIKADVEIGSVVDDMDRFQKILGWQKNPRVSVSVEKGLNAGYLPSANKAASFLTRELIGNGFSVFGSSDNKIQMGLNIGISIEVSTSSSVYKGLPLPVNEVSLTLNIYRAGDREIIATSNAVKSVGGVNKLKALDKGLKFCLDKVWRDTKDQLVDLWEKELYNDRDLYLTLKAIPTHAEAIQISSILNADVKGVVSSKLINFNNGNAQYIVKYKGWPEYFVNEIQMSYFRNRYFNHIIENIMGNNIVIVKK